MNTARIAVFGLLVVAGTPTRATEQGQAGRMSGNAATVEDKAASPPPKDTSPTENKAAPEKSAQIDIVRAFTIGLGALKGKVDLLKTNAAMVIHSTNGGWLIQFEGYPDAPQEGLSVKVARDASVTVHLTMGRGSPDVWFALADGGKSDTKGRLRPEVAFRKSVEFIRANRKTLDWSDAKGQIKLWRTGDESWFFAMTGYPNMHLGGCWLIVGDNGVLKVAPAL